MSFLSPNSTPVSPNSTPDVVSKVTFSPVSDSTGNQALIVTIKRVIPEAEEVPKIMETPKIRSSSADSKRSSSDTRRKTRSRMSPNNKSTMTEKRQERSFETQTPVTLAVTETSNVAGVYRLKHDFKMAPGPTGMSEIDLDTGAASYAVSMSRLKLESGAASSPSGAPCLKHAAENITRKASTIKSDKVSLCNNCSKSMLSYIFVVQDFLDSLAKEICGNADTQNCLQCLRQEIRMEMISKDDAASSVCLGERKSSKSRTKESHGAKSGEDSLTRKRSVRTKETTRDVRRYEESSEKLIERSISQHRQVYQQDQQKTYSQVGEQQTQSFSSSHDQKDGHQGTHQDSWPHHVSHDKQTGNQTYSSQSESQSYPGTHDHHGTYHSSPDGATNPSVPTAEEPMHSQLSSGQDETFSPQQRGQDEIFSPQQTGQGVPFRRSIHRQRPDFVFHRDGDDGRRDSSSETNFQSSVSSPFSEDVDGIVSTLSNAEREVYDAARNGAGWEGLNEAQERLISSSSTPIPSEAYVTMCRNNAEALGCLVVGTSLLLSRTTRTLCVVVSDGVSNAFRGPLSSVFHIVQCVRSMDSLGTTKLALLEQPELGVSFEKLNIWRLVQFNKCVFLNPDTLVIQNCDELFCRDELSAVADIGWPDCFNSGVFVFVPSLQTFWQLLEFAEKQGSYDGGDQGLLNSYFNSWSEDMSKKLSFIYNLMANVSYTYTPAFKQFGRNVKVVQFHGSFKPWHVKYYSRTGQISSETAVHPTYVQFVHIWINIFRISAVKQLPQDIRSYAQSQDLLCAVELLRFFPLPTESEAEFFLTPPSVRLRLTERKLQKTVIQHKEEEARRRKSAEFSTRLPTSDDENVITHEKDVRPSDRDVITHCSESTEVGQGGMVGSMPIDDSAVPQSEKPIPVENPLPGAEVGNYQGMKAWEQGRMDYQGTDSSDTIIKRLEFLMSQSK